MAITPWSWTSSNGTATAAQTQAAYAALTSNGNTSSFHRNVWNDFVNKVNQVLAALNLSWADTYGTISNTRMNYAYEDLTAARFNALRYNTRYNSWSWAINPGLPGYVGRDNFIGIGSVGENNADVVYGRYFLELAERLNLVIGIINGTAPTHDLDKSLIACLIPETELFAGVAAQAQSTESGILVPTPTLESTNIPGWTLHFLVLSPSFHASLEADEMASKFAVYLYMSLDAGNRRLVRLPPISISVLISAGLSAQSFLRTVQSLSFTAEASGTSSALGEVNSIASGSIGGSAHSVHTVTGSGVSLPMINPGWCHTRVNLDLRNTLAAEMVREFISLTGLKLKAAPSIITRQPTLFTAGTHIFTDSFPNIETTSPLGVTAESIINSPIISATVGSAQFIKDFLIETVINSPAMFARIELDHISTLLQAYLTLAASGDAMLENIEPLPLEQATDIMVPITSEMVADFSPAIEHLIEIGLEINSHAHSDIAGIFERYTGISLDFRGDGVAGVAGILEPETHNYKLNIIDTLNSPRSIPTGARSVARHTTDGIVHTAWSVPSGSHTILPFAPITVADLTAIYGLREMFSEIRIAHDISGGMDALNQLASAGALSEVNTSLTSELGYVFHTDLAAYVSMSFYADGEMATEGGGGWQYPVYLGGDLTVYQAQLAEKNRSHIFIDPMASVSRLAITNNIVSTAEYWMTIATGGELVHGVNTHSSVDYLDSTLWEHPVKTENDLYISQAVSAKQKQTYKLEVI